MIGDSPEPIDVYNEAECLQHIRRLVEVDDVLFGPHALNAMEQEVPRFIVEDVYDVLRSGKILENYPEAVRGSCCLINGNSTVVASFTLDLSTLAGGAAVVLASGFLNPAENKNRNPFGLIAVLPDGTVVELPAATAQARTLSENRVTMFGNYPNPFNPTTTIRFDLPSQAEVSIDIFDMLGRTVLSVPAQRMAAGRAQRIRVDGSTLASGLYLYRVTARMEGKVQIQTGRMTLLK